MKSSLARDETGASSGRLEERLLEESLAVRRFLARLTHRPSSAHEVDDLHQEVMARALRYRDRYDPTRELRPWLHTIAFRVFLDHRRRLAAEPLNLGAETSELVATPAAAAEGRESCEHHLQRLPTREQEIVRSFYLEGRTIAELAEALQLPEGTVKSHLHRARRKLARGAQREEQG